jgi:hypothetical protein
MSRFDSPGAGGEDTQPIELPDGQVVQVHPFDQVALDHYRALMADMRNGMRSWDIAASVLPELTLEQVKHLTAPEIRVVLNIAFTLGGPHAEAIKQIVSNFAFRPDLN